MHHIGAHFGQKSCVFGPRQLVTQKVLKVAKELTVLIYILWKSRSDFVTWMSALRLAKYGGDELSLAYKNCLMPPAPSIGKYLYN